MRCASRAVAGTLVVGPFYLSRRLGLEAALGGLAMSLGPFVATCLDRLTYGIGESAAPLGQQIILTIAALTLPCPPFDGDER